MDFYHPPNQVYQVKPVKISSMSSLPSIRVSMDFGTPPQVVASVLAKATLAPSSTPYSFDDLKVKVVARPSTLTAIAGPFMTHLPNDPTTSTYGTTIEAVDPVSSFWRTFAITAACVIFLLELYINTRQWRIRSSTTSKDSLAKNDIVKGRAAYNVLHSALSALRVGLLLGFDSVPWLWTLTGQLQSALFPVASERMADFWQCFFFFVACGVCYNFLHLPDSALHFCFKGESLFKSMKNNWTPSQITRNVSNGRSAYVVVFLCIILILIIKPFFARITTTLEFSIIVLQLLFATVTTFVSQPRKSALSLMQDEVLVEAITELATTAKFPLKNIYISSSTLLDRDVEEEGVRVCGWPRKNCIVVNQRMLAEFTSEDILALLAKTMGEWQGSVGLRRVFMSQLAITNILCQILVFVNASEIYLTFGFPATAEGDVPPGAAAVIVFTVTLARPFYLYYSAMTNYSARAFAFQGDNHAAKLGYSSELSTVLAKISSLISRSSATSRQETEQEQEHVDDILYAILYNAHSSPQISQRLQWLEQERVKEDAKEGCIRLSLDNEKI